MAAIFDWQCESEQAFWTVVSIHQGLGLVRKALRGHMHSGKNPNGAWGAGILGLAVILVPKGTTGMPAIVKKRKTGLGNLFQGGLGAMRRTRTHKHDHSHTHTQARSRAHAHAHAHALARIAHIGAFVQLCLDVVRLPRLPLGEFRMLCCGVIGGSG